MTGPAFVLVFVFLSAFRDVFFADTLRAAPFFAVALIAFATCSAAFLIVALLERERSLRVVFADWRTFVLVNATTAVSWLMYFQSLRFVEPAIANVLYAGVGPLVVLGMTAAGWRIVDAGRMTAVETACQAAMAVCLGGIVAIALLGLSAGEGGTPAAIGCTLAAASGCTITFATLYAKRLHEAGASAAAVVATRFIGVLLVAFVAIPLGPEPARSAALSVSAWLAVAPAAFLFMAVPIYFNQIGVKLASPITVRVLLALGPVFVVLLQTAVGGLPLSGWSLAGVTIYCAIAIGAALARVLSAGAATARLPAAPA
jgi:drug/metabolite transporter (DMT)-like permease